MEIPVQQVFSELIEQAEAPMVVSLDLEYSDGATSAVPLTAVLQGKDRERVSRALEGSRSANTRKSYARAWTAFERWCLEKRTSSMPADPEFIAAYLADRAESGWKISTIRVAWAAISDAHRQAGHPDVAEHLGIRRTISGLARGDRRPQRQAQGLTSEAMAAIRATAFNRRRVGGRGSPVESEAAARRRGSVDIAICSALRDAMLRRSELAALCWGDVDLREDGTGRILLRASKSDQEGEGEVLFIGPDCARDLLTIRPDVPEPEGPVFRLSSSQIGRRIKEAGKVAGLGHGFTGHSGRIGMARDLSAAGVELPALMTAGRWSSPTMPARYTRNEAAARGAVAKYYAQKGGRG